MQINVPAIRSSNALPIVIIGAGIGGLSAAIRLASKGQRVVIFEKNNQPGGKMAEFTHQGFRWDLGPSVITMRAVFEDLFLSANRQMDEYLHLLPLEPITRYFFPDGMRVDISSNLQKTLDEIRKLSHKAPEEYLAFLAYAARIHRITAPVFIHSNPPQLSSLAKVHPLDIPRIDALRSMHQAIASFTKSPHLQQILGRFATYVGADPYQAPATLNVIAHVELSQGVWYPSGGIYAIARALSHLAEELGVEIHCNSPVAQIETQSGSITGVRLADGRQLKAAAVLSNVDVFYTYTQLLRNAIDKSVNDRLLGRSTSSSGVIWLAAKKQLAFADGRTDTDILAHHNIFFSADYRNEFKQLTNEARLPDDPTVYLAITSKTDPQHAPPGYENWFALINAPSDPSIDRQTLSQYRAVITAKLADYGLYTLPDAFAWEKIIGPADIEQATNATRGALYGSSSNETLAAFLRPHNRSKEIHGLYFAGGTTHPGGGVPMVILSGNVAARAILANLGKSL